jgi:nucleoside-diphosphate-sugar epimerase
LIETTSSEYYGKGYQDVQNRVPSIQKAMDDLGWAPTISMKDALKNTFDSYRNQIALAKTLNDEVSTEN